MCGFAGFWTPTGSTRDACGVLRRMTHSLRHRGPDDEGYWHDETAGIGLGHRRLAIVDLSPEGHQPMVSREGRYVIVFNGEIYNHQELRAELQLDGIAFRGHSDTEVMLSAIERWGLYRAVERFAGMFAFALWDAAERTLYLVRDRLGEKPLYYTSLESSVLFGSELKALRACPWWRGEIDRDALALYLRHAYVPAPYSIYRSVHKVRPGTVLAFRSGDPTVAPQERPYWSAQEAVEQALAAPLPDGKAGVVDALDALLRRVVSREMIADVPLGAFLSGGIDSSSIVALMQAQSHRPVRTFTIGFAERRYDEAGYARAVARALGTDHTELYVGPADLLAVVPSMPVVYDEPFGDSSQIPTALLAALTRQHVTVSLSGDGGDELFGGYERYRRGRRLWQMLRRLPVPLRLAVGAMAGAIPGVGRGAISGERVRNWAPVLRVKTFEDMYRELVSLCREPHMLVAHSAELVTVFTDRGRWAATSNSLERMMFLDLTSYLPDDILVKVDRATMAVGLESRAPFLDHEVVEFAWRVPQKLKTRNGDGKVLLRELLRRYVPRPLVDRPKMGFGVPLESWLAGPLREWASDLLAPAKLKRDGLLNATVVADKWQRHQAGTGRCHELLWAVLMFQSWLEAQGVGAVP
jgi:asparagine synthase (glutamine-hydrolysing)